MCEAGNSIASVMLIFMVMVSELWGKEKGRDVEPRAIGKVG
jgi:hypothetical protein